MSGSGLPVLASETCLYRGEKSSLPGMQGEGNEEVVKILLAFLHKNMYIIELSPRCDKIRQNVPLAQLDRAFDYESKGREFESLRARHFNP